jgi:adenine-specific DNA-methyltransferase
MKKITTDDPRSQSLDLTAQNVDQLKAIFPEAFTEGKIDFEVLRQLLGDTVDEEKERYGLNWHGKRQARQLALSPSRGTLRPAPEESVDWDTTQNLMIEGDNLEVLKLLQKSYASRVKLIYIDPPYNTRNKEFVYEDDFRDPIRSYLERVGQIDENGERLTSSKETSGRLHSNWLNMMYPRLKLARDMLRHDGVLFVSIDKKEYSHLWIVCSEIFGEENYIGTVIWKNVTDNNPSRIAIEHEYILCFAKNLNEVDPVWKSSESKAKNLLVSKGEELIRSNSNLEELQDAYTEWYKDNKALLGPLADYKFIDRGGVYAGSRSVHNPGKEGYRYDVIHPKTGEPCKQPLLGYRFPEATMQKMLAEGRIIFGKDHNKLIEIKSYAHEYKEKLSSVYELDGRKGVNDFKSILNQDISEFTTPKPVTLLRDLLAFGAYDGGLVLDFFAGSGTIAHAVSELNASGMANYRYIAVQLPERNNRDGSTRRSGVNTIADLCKLRLRNVHKKYHRENPDIDSGFKVFKLDESNIRPWNLQPADLEAELLAGVEHILPGRGEHDLFYEVMLKRGLDLCTPVETRVIEGKTVYCAGAGALFG